MKILHTADWHLGKKLEHIPRLEEQKAFLQEIVAIANQKDVDAVLIAGDIFDTYNPPAEAVEIYYQTIKALTDNGTRPVVIIAGNHDAPDRIEAPDPLARSCGIICSGYLSSVIKPFSLSSGLAVTHSAPGFISISLPNCTAPLNLFLTPYANERRLKKYLGTEDEDENLRQHLSSFWQDTMEQTKEIQGINVLIGHCFMVDQPNETYQEPEAEKPILHVGGAQVLFAEQIPNGMHYVALGHLHRPHGLTKGPCPIRYAGSPISYSFSEANQNKSVCLVELSLTTEPVIEKISLTSGRKLSKATFHSVEEAKEWLMAHSNDIVELTMKTKTFLSPAEKQALFDINPDIFIIPMPEKMMGDEMQHSKLDISQRIDDLFITYFKHKNQGQEPSAELLELFKVVIGENDDV